MLKQRNSGRSNPLNLTYKVYNPNTGALLSSTVQTAIAAPPLSSETIAYMNSGKTIFNDCTHHKDVFLKIFSGEVKAKENSDPGWISGFVDAEHYFHHIDPAPPVPALGSVDQFVLRGIQAIRPKFKSKVSLPNFLFELKDIKRTIETISHSLNDFAKLPWVSKGLPNPYKQKYLFKKGVRTKGDSLSAHTADNYLAAQFGYMPMMRDIFTLMSVLSDFNKQLEKFQRDAGTTQTGHYQEMIDAIGGTRDFPWVGSYGSHRSEDQFSRIRLGLTVKYSYVINMPNLYMPTTFLKYIGFRNNPRILWDAIPFSFLVDWVFRFGKMLETFDDGAIPVSMTIIDACVTVKYSGVTKHKYIASSTASGVYSIASGTTMAQQGFEVFQRWRMELGSVLLSGLPPMPTFDKLSVGEVLLGAALGKSLSKGRR